MLWCRLPLGSVLAGILSGRLYDTVGVQTTLLAATAVSLVGTLIALRGVEKSR